MANPYQRQMGRLKPAVTGDAGSFVLRGLGPRNIGEGEILRGAQNDGSFEARENSRTKVLTPGRGRIIVTASMVNDCSSECDQSSAYSSGSRLSVATCARVGTGAPAVDGRSG